MTELTISEPGFKDVWLRKFQIFINKFIFILWTGILIYAVGPYYSIRELFRHLQIFGKYGLIIIHFIHIFRFDFFLSFRNLHHQSQNDMIYDIIRFQKT